MRKRVVVFFIALMLLTPMYKNFENVKAESRQRVIFLCQKEEFSSSLVLKRFISQKRAMGYETIVEVRPELFLEPVKLKAWLSKQEYFVIYAIGNLGFFPVSHVETSYPNKSILWDASYWWPAYDFKYGGPLPTSAPKLLARIPVDNLKQLDKFLSVADVISEQLFAVVATTNVVSEQRSEMFPHYTYKAVSNYEPMRKISTLFGSSSTFLVEKRGDKPLSKKVVEKQLDSNVFIEALNKANVAVLTSTADKITEMYWEEKDSLKPIAKTRNALATSYSKEGVVVEEDFLSDKDVVEKKNRLILLQNFYNRPEELNTVFNIARCVLSMYPNVIEFHRSQVDYANFKEGVLTSFLKGEILADSIIEQAKKDNESKTDFVVWGDPLIRKDDLLSNPVEIDLGFKRQFVYEAGRQVDFINLPEVLTYETKDKEYSFRCLIPVAGFIVFDGNAVVEWFLFLEFQEKETKKRGWIFLKFKIFNFWGIPKSPLF